ncbi:hypothetical protein H8I11_18670 [Bacillus pumilus]|nr:hypothetical protein [Bacillus pumilus]
MGSEMCIRDSMYEDMLHPVQLDHKDGIAQYELIIHEQKKYRCLLYTSDAADECVNV